MSDYNHIFFSCYIVQKGDTLESIASFYGVDVEDILEQNDHVKIQGLIAGGFLLIPKAKIKSN